jgi:hypothetical protein
MSIGAALALAACTSGSPSSSPTPSGSSPSSAAVTAPRAPTRTGSLLSGRAAKDGQVIAVKIDNTADAHPQIGVEAADVVYVEEVEGGLTRLAAIYSSTYPAQVGPVRSGRITDISLLHQYGVVGLVYSGSQPRMIAPLQASTLKLVSFDTSAAGFHRVASRPAPYNVVGDLAALRERAGTTSVPRSVGYTFGAAPAGGSAAEQLTVGWPAGRLSMQWSAGVHRWLVSMDGRASRTPTGAQLGATTVVVQRVSLVASPYHDVNGNNTPDSKTVGSGTGLVLRDGKVYQATWTRRSDTDTTHWAVGGKPAVFAPGQIWVALVGTGRSVTVS